jgi:hypothetical protein
MARIFLLAMEDVVGQNSLQAVFNLARTPHLMEVLPPPDFEPGMSFGELSSILGAFDEMYGVSDGQRLAARMGRHSFGYGIGDFGPILGVADLALRLMPTAMRVRMGMEVLTEIFNRYSDQRVALSEDDERYYWRIERCGFCWERHADYPVCGLGVGLLEEALYWVSRGKRFDVEELSCVAMGDVECTLAVAKRPS